MSTTGDQGSRECRETIESRFREALLELLDTRPSRVIPAFTEVLASRDVRVLLAAVGIGDFPQVAATLNLDDVTEEIAKQVILRVLDRVGMPKDAAALMGATAATVVSRWVAKQRMTRAVAREAAGDQGSRECRVDVQGTRIDDPGAVRTWRPKVRS